MPGSEGAGYQGCGGSCSQQTMQGHSGPVFSHNSPLSLPSCGAMLASAAVKSGQGSALAMELLRVSSAPEQESQLLLPCLLHTPPCTRT